MGGEVYIGPIDRDSMGFHRGPIGPIGGSIKGLLTSAPIEFHRDPIGLYGGVYIGPSP